MLKYSNRYLGNQTLIFFPIPINTQAPSCAAQHFLCRWDWGVENKQEATTAPCPASESLCCKGILTPLGELIPHLTPHNQQSCSALHRGLRRAVAGKVVALLPCSIGKMKQTRTEATCLVTQQVVGDSGTAAQMLLSPAFYRLDKGGWFNMPSR